MSQGSNFIGKLFGKERKEEKILRASYRAGQKKAEKELGSRLRSTSSASSSISSDEEVYHGNAPGGKSAHTPASHKHDADASVIGASAAAGTVAGTHDKHQSKDTQSAFGNSHGHKKTASDASSKFSSSSKGQVVSQPPKVHRQPLDQTYGGDYADGKTPTELATYHAKPVDDKGMVSNDHPRYENDANQVKGHGQFFDPKDTQGGLYHSGEGGTNNASHKDKHTPIGAKAVAASANLPGGVSKGEYTDDAEATHAQLQQRNLKIKPTAYAQEESARKRAEEIETEAYNAGRRKGLGDAKKGHGFSQETHGSDHSKALDPKKEHEKNRSAYNEAGVAGATAEAKHGTSQASQQNATTQHTSIDSRKVKPNEHAESGASKYSGAGAGTTIKATSEGTATSHAKRNDEAHRSLDPAVNHPASTGQAGDQSTKPVAVAAVQSGHMSGSHKPSDYDQQIKRLDQSIAQTQKEIDALGNTSVYNSSSGLVHHSTVGNNSMADSKHTIIGHAGVSGGQPTNVKATSQKPSGAASSKGETPRLNNHNETTGSADPGLFGGVAGAASAAGALAASAIGLTGSNEETKNSQPATSNKSVNPSTVSSHDSSLKPDLENSLYNAGYSKGQGEQGKSDYASHQLRDEEDDGQAGYLDSAKSAIASAGVAAASAFGYDGYNNYYNDENHTRDVVRDREAAEDALSKPASGKENLSGNVNSNFKPSAAAAGEQHPHETATSGVEVLAGKKDSRSANSTHNATGDAKRSAGSADEPEGLLSKVGLGSSGHTSSKNASEASKANSGIGSTIAGAAAGAASAAGLSNKSNEHHKVESLVEEAASEYDDVRREPRHKTKGGVLEDTEDKSKTLPDDLDPSKQKSSQAETSGVDNTKLEADIAAYNKKHGYTKGKSLVEVAEEQFPEIKQKPAHREDADDAAVNPRQRTPLNEQTEGATSGLAATAAGKKLADAEHAKAKSVRQTGESTDSTKDSSVKEVSHRADSKAASDDASHNSQPASNVADLSGSSDSYRAGKSVDTLDASATEKSKRNNADVGASSQSEGSGRRGFHAPPVVDAATGKSREESQEIENAAFAAGAGRFGTTEGRSSYSEPASFSVAGKSRQESIEIQQASQLQNIDKGSSQSHPATEAATGKEGGECREIEEAAYAAGHRHGTNNPPSASKAVSSRKLNDGDKISSQYVKEGAAARPVIEVIGISDRDEAQKVAQRTTRELLSKGEDLTGSKIVIDANKQEVYKKTQGASSGSSGKVDGRKDPDASYNEPQREVDGSKNHKLHEKVKTTLEHEAERGNLGNIQGEDHHYPTKSTGSAPGLTGSLGNGRNSLERQPDASFYEATREVDGSKNHKLHEKVKTTLEHEAERGNLGNIQGEDHHYPTKSTGSAPGLTGSLGNGSNSLERQPDASFYEATREVDGSKNHKLHEKVKTTLEHEAERGKLGNITAEHHQVNPNYSSSGMSDSPNANNLSPRGLSVNQGSTEARKHSYSHRHELSGREVSTTEVTVSGEPDTKRAQLLAQEAIASLKGRKDILAAKELSVDAYTGAICDQDGRFVAQLSQRRLSQADLGHKRRSSGGLVSLNSQAANQQSTTSKTFPVAHEKVSASLRQAGSEGPFTDKYNLTSAQSTTKSEQIYKMPGSFF